MKRVLPAKGGGRLAVRCWVGFGSGRWRGMRAVRASVSWPARPAGLRKRRAAPLWFWVGRVGYLAKAEREPAVLLFRNLRRMGAFAVVGRSWVVGVMTGSGCAGRHRLGLGVGLAAQTERSGVLRLCGFGWVGLAMSKVGKMILRMGRFLDGDEILISIAFSCIFFYYVLNMLTPLPVRTARSGWAFCFYVGTLLFYAGTVYKTIFKP